VKTSLTQAEINAARIETWRPYLKLDLPGVDKESLLKLANEIASKLDHSARMMSQLVAYNQGVSNVNRLISDYKAKLTSSDAAKLGQELNLMKDQRARHKNAAELCDTYSKLLQEKTSLDAQKTKLKKDLDAHSGNIIPAYQKGINDHLASFGAGFRLCNVEQNYVGKKPTSNYCIEINSTRVELGNEESPENIASFGNTLSAGDKSTLAFAFFLARLDRDLGLSNKVVVLDDPISSLDSHRKTFTRSNILRLTATAKQVVVLTHDPMYAWDLFEEARKKKLNPVAIKILGVGEDSSMAEWDIKWETSSDHYKAYSSIHSYLDQGSPSQDGLREVVNFVRPLVEGSMRHRFPMHFDSEMMLSQMIKKVREADAADAIFILMPLILKMEQINLYGTPVHHSGRGGEGTSVINENELRVHCKLALELAHGLVEVEGTHKN
jgi:wobble nucleotide-excising tRNase